MTRMLLVIVFSKSITIGYAPQVVGFRIQLNVRSLTLDHYRGTKLDLPVRIAVIDFYIG